MEARSLVSLALEVDLPSLVVDKNMESKSNRFSA